MKDLEDYAIQATDGDIGHVKDAYFDDEQWVVRYLIVETGSWLSSRKVLISPVAIGHPDWNGRVLPVSITKEQVKRSPDIDTEKPVSRQHEMQYLGFYGYPYYWGGAGLWGNGFSPSMMLTQGYAGQERASPKGRAGGEAGRDGQGDPHLRSCKAVMGYHIEASDGEIGHVENVLIDEETWAIRYLIADTSNWWMGHQVLIAPQWIQKVRLDNTVAVDATQQTIKDAPPYDAAIPLGRDQETALYRHHGRAGYWAEEGKRENREFPLSPLSSQADKYRPGGAAGHDRTPGG